MPLTQYAATSLTYIYVRKLAKRHMKILQPHFNTSGGGGHPPQTPPPRTLCYITDILTLLCEQFSLKKTVLRVTPIMDLGSMLGFEDSWLSRVPLYLGTWDTRTELSQGKVSTEIILTFHYHCTNKQLNCEYCRFIGANFLLFRS